MGVSRYEDLHVWQKARVLCAEIRLLLDRETGSLDLVVRRQLFGAAVSTVANIAEGFLRRSRKDFAQFIRIAGASNGEARALLYVLKDQAGLDQCQLDRLIDLTNEIGRMLRALEHYLRSPVR